MPRDEALDRAARRDLDLVEVAPQADPPVARLLDYSKYKYEQEQKAKAARKHQQQVNVREIKLRPKIADHDYETKKGHVERFLRQQDKVKVTIMFRGREQAHPERGRMLLDRLVGDIEPLATIEQEPEQEGRNMTMLLGADLGRRPGRLDGRSACAASIGARCRRRRPIPGAKKRFRKTARASCADGAPTPATSWRRSRQKRKRRFARPVPISAQDRPAGPRAARRKGRE